MNARVVAVRAGVRRGRVEFTRGVTDVGELVGWLWMPVVALVVLHVFGDDPVPGADLPLGAHAVPGVLAMSAVFTGLLGLALALTTDREDGTLLRARATPGGVVGYVVGTVLAKAALTVTVLLLVLVPSFFLFDGLAPGRVSTWVALAGVVALGLLATLPLGVVIGAAVGGTSRLGLVSLLVMALLVVSGVFYPITALPGWAQAVGQAFPLYWFGLGLRSALLPDAAAAAEVGGGWRPVRTAVVLGLWAVVGFALAPPLLRRTVRREPGAPVPGRPVS
ncbi:ABC transporter permease [Saccharothrix longispora]|uniref:ABC transporter permease n=1 Tax=Saccharothrix longispora TaxID=33920 RepID=UPI0028FDAA18|nr:ABC transporter permease [Saccharothrix longispora]MDU0290555.1 ABC transporter permease [Saccharothrix longispora]